MQAHRDVMAGLMATMGERDEQAATLRALECERLDALTLAMWPSATKGDAEAVRACVRIAERRARLLGLDAATQTKLELAGRGVGGAVLVQHEAAALHALQHMSVAELDRELTRLAEVLRADAGLVRPLAAAVAAPEPVPLSDEDRYARALERQASKGNRNGRIC